MEPVVVDEDDVHIKDDRAEERDIVAGKCQRDEMCEQGSSSDSVGSSSEDSLNSTAKTASGFYPSSLLWSKDQAEGEIPRASDKDRDAESGKEPRTSEPEVGDNPSRPNEVIEKSSLGGTITDVFAERWSVVGRFTDENAPEGEAQPKSHSTSGQWEEGTPELGDPNISRRAQSFGTFSEPEVLEGDCQTSPSVSASSLRRRPRSSSTRRADDASTVSFVGAHISPFSESIDIASIAERPGAFEPRNDAFSGVVGNIDAGSQLQNEDGDFVSMADLATRKSRSYFAGRQSDDSIVNFVGGHVSRFSDSIDIASIAERPDAFERENDALFGTSGATEVESKVPNENDEIVAKADGSNVLGSKREPKFHYGYDPELEEDRHVVSSASSREANDGEDLWKADDSSQRRGQSEEVSSSRDSGEKSSFPETRQRKGVYRMPGSEAEGEESGGEVPPQVLAQPAGFVVRAIEFQLNLIVHMLAIGIWLVSFTLSTLSHPITRTVEVKDKVTKVTAGAANQLLEVFSYSGDGISQAGHAVSKLSKKTIWGCLVVAYMVFMLCLLLIPALFADIIIVNSLVEKQLVVRQALDFDFTQPRPIAVLPLFPEKEIERIKSLPLDKVVRTRVIPQGSKFQVSVLLTLPESDYNMKMGMFQVTAELLSARDQVILRSSKPCRLRYRSFPIQLVKTLVYAVPHLVGLSNEAQTIKIRLLEAQEKSIPTASVRIVIEPKARDHDQGGVPDIYDASIRLESILPWPRSIMTRWKWLFFLWNGLCLFLFEVAIVLCCCRQVLIPSFGRKTAAEGETVQGVVKDAEGETVQGVVKDERESRGAARDGRSSRKGRSNRRVYFENAITSSEHSIPEVYEDN